MNRIVRQHYPVEKLPEDLRGGLSAGQSVTITVEEEGGTSADTFDARVAEILRHPQPMTLREICDLVGHRNVSAEEAVSRIRALRDEWN